MITKYTHRWRTGWAATVELEDGDLYTVRVTRGRYKGKVFGNRSYHWSADVRGPKVDKRFGTSKGATASQIVQWILDQEAS